MSMADAFAGIAQGFSAAGLGAFYDAFARWPGAPTYDNGGSIATPGTPIEKECSAQVDGVTEAMRLEAGFRDKDVRLLVLCATLDGTMDTDAEIEVLAGPNAGRWSVESVGTDPVGACWECRGRRVDAPAGAET